MKIRQTAEAEGNKFDFGISVPIGAIATALGDEKDISLCHRDGFVFDSEPRVPLYQIRQIVGARAPIVVGIFVLDEGKRVEREAFAEKCAVHGKIHPFCVENYALF